MVLLDFTLVFSFSMGLTCACDLWECVRRSDLRLASSFSWMLMNFHCSPRFDSVEKILVYLEGKTLPGIAILEGK